LTGDGLAYFVFAISQGIVMLLQGSTFQRCYEKVSSVTDVDRKNSDFVGENRSNRPSAVTGRDIVAALASSPLADVPFGRLTVRPSAVEVAPEQTTSLKAS
jgi:hypothetical protein